MAKPKFKFVPDNVRNLVIEECANCVPRNWCDELLTGPKAPKGPLDSRDVERLLCGIQDRIRALKSAEERG
jgi:hypothetical protein